MNTICIIVEGRNYTQDRKLQVACKTRSAAVKWIKQNRPNHKWAFPAGLYSDGDANKNTYIKIVRVPLWKPKNTK